MCGVLYGLLTVILRTVPGQAARQEWRAIVRLKARNLTLAVALAMAVGVLSVNGYWFVRGVDVQRHTLDLARSIGAGTWTTILAALSRLALAVVALLVVSRIARRLLRAAQPWLNRWDQLGDNNRSLGTLFAGLEGAVVNIVKSAVLAPIPNARMRRAVAARPGSRLNRRIAWRRSWVHMRH